MLETAVMCVRLVANTSRDKFADLL